MPKEGRPSDEETLRVETPKVPRLILTALWDGGSFTHFVEPGARVVLGRGSAADVVIEHPSISRRHVVLELGDDLAVTDLGSSNGTKIRGRKLEAEERVTVGWGEPFEVGHAVLIVRRPAADGRDLYGTEVDQTSMDSVERLLHLVAPTHISVLLLGETGVGKGFYARKIHDLSTRAAGPWLHLNCAALSEQLLEGELFGYEKGAFTGAVQSKIGLLESASGGTVFLDEVGDLPPAIQAKLLLALERREVIRVGSLKPRSFDVRFISATNRWEHGAVSDGFRSDLYYRLAGMPISIPPLRQRKREIPGLVTKLLSEAAAKFGRPVPQVSTDAMAKLTSFDWPGNVRELASVLERAMLFAPGEIGAAHVELSRGPSMRPSAPPASRSGELRATDAAAPHVPSSVLPPPSVPRPGPPNKTLAEDVTEVERRRILEALEQCAGNQVRAAELLGVSRRTLINRMIAYAIPRPRKG
jgi:two-component system, NtrC family, response regulator AtoC